LYLAPTHMRTIPQLFEDSCDQFPDNVLIREKLNGEYLEITYHDLRKDVYSVAAELINKGVSKGDRIALFAEGSSQWLVAELAIFYVGAVSVPLSVKINQSNDLLFRLNHSGCKTIFVSSDELPKIRGIKKELGKVKSYIVFNPKTDLERNEADYNQLLKDGSRFYINQKNEIYKRWKNIQEDDTASISYTSGTTAEPKGIILTHRNYTANVEQSCSLFDVPSWYTTLLILSWDHSFAHTVGLYVMMKNGASISVVDPGNSPMERLRNIPVNIREVKPVFLLSVPAMARNFKKNIESGIRAKGKVTEKLFSTALKIAYYYHGDGWSRKTTGQVLLKPMLKFYDRILFSKIRKNFGGRLKFFTGGGALLDLELQRFFYAIGIPMYQGYGLTEAAPVISSNTPDIHKMGTSGILVSDLDLKILDEKGVECAINTKGEIVVKGENVMKGYWRNERATSETLKDGWLHTGDLGFLDQDGFLHVLGRFKSLLIGNDGEKYSPEGIEEAMIDNSKYIDQCMLHNNQDTYTIGLIVPSKPALIKFLKNNSIERNSDQAIESILKQIKKELDQYLPGGEFENLFPGRWLPSAVAILDGPFTEENGMINSTLKMVRSKVTAYHKETIEYLYTNEGRKLDNLINITNLKRLLNH
jgi:long-chain acyl-CoA synthetase